MDLTGQNRLKVAVKHVMKWNCLHDLIFWYRFWAKMKLFFPVLCILPNYKRHENGRFWCEYWQEGTRIYQWHQSRSRPIEQLDMILRLPLYALFLLLIFQHVLLQKTNPIPKLIQGLTYKQIFATCLALFIHVMKKKNNEKPFSIKLWCVYPFDYKF